MFCALLAQLDRATGFEPVGREFESLRAHFFISISAATVQQKTTRMLRAMSMGGYRKILFLTSLLLLSSVACSRGVRVELGDIDFSSLGGDSDVRAEFYLNTPKSWVVDYEMARELGLPLVFHPKGETFKYAEAVMYAGALSKIRNGVRSFEQVMEDDIQEFRKGKPKVEVKRVPDIRTKRDNKSAIVKSFTGGKEGLQSHEAVAYINEPNIVVMIAISARSEDAFNEAYPAFKALVESYSFSARNL